MNIIDGAVQYLALEQPFGDVSIGAVIGPPPVLVMELPHHHHRQNGEENR